MRYILVARTLANTTSTIAAAAAFENKLLPFGPKIIAASLFCCIFSGAAYSETGCAPEQWAMKFTEELGAGQSRCCHCIGTPEQCEKETAADKPVIACERDIIFGYNSDKLTDEAKNSLENFKRSIALLGIKNIRFYLTGHTDAVGSKSFNIALSSRRAENVKNFLVEQSLSEKQFKIKAYGASLPKQGNNSVAKLRRVEIHLRRLNDD